MNNIAAETEISLLKSDIADAVISEAKRVINEEKEALDNAARQLDESIVKAALALTAARKILVCGIGKSGLIGRKIAATFSSIGAPAVFMHPLEALHGDIGIAETGDIALFLSKSGNTKELLEIIPFLKKKGIGIILFAGKLDSPLSRNVDIVINASVEKEACPLNVAPMSSTTVALALGDALAACIMLLKKVQLQDFAERHPLGQLGRNLTLRVRDVMHSGRDLPQVFLEATFREAVIEISAKGLGCVAVIDEKKLSGIITDGDVRRALQKYDDIRFLKAKDVMTAGPISVSPDLLLGEALAIMEAREQQISVLPVINEEQKYLGIIRIHDIIRSGM
ncbi:MAG TPA: KpsF/GutQ family sugar-phosphate isomerase [Patescibacteria group bacterium]|nr:KpsF/GutQ family sugar-phosphate isomerase [Patescibacteria group bacterium]